MIFYYALGGGLGHLVRAKKVLRALNIETFKVITSHQHLSSLIFANHQLIPLPEKCLQHPEQVSDWINALIAEYKPTSLFIDTFPLGLCGELSNKNLQSTWFEKADLKKTNLEQTNLELVYVARYLKWPEYVQSTDTNESLDKLHFDRCLIIDKLHSEQEKFVKSHCNLIEHTELKHLNENSDLDVFYQGSNCLEKRALEKKVASEKIWLVAHSMPSSELIELLQYAREIAELEHIKPHYAICTSLSVTELPSEFSKADITVFNAHPISAFFSKCERLFTGCGYNIMNETLNYSGKHHFIPFPRRYDNQFLRAKARRDAQLP